MADRLAPRPFTEPNESRLRADHPRRAEILDAHRTALESGASTYADPETGLMVFTAASLAATGRCCDTGCRHCPFGAL